LTPIAVGFAGSLSLLLSHVLQLSYDCLCTCSTHYLDISAH